MKRLAYENLIKWKAQKRRKPLLVQGARQVGKTYLIREFGKNEYDDCAYFNFELEPRLSSLFESTLDPEILVESLSAYRAKKINHESCLIFFDEIQICPRALTSLKYFEEQAGNFHVVAAGSLLGVCQGKKSSFPVGKVNFMTLYAMSFFEFLYSSDEQILLEHLITKKTLEPLSELLHEKLLRLFKFYLYLGGMPEVVDYYIQNRDIEGARLIQKEIIEAYKRDFSKYSTPGEAIRLSEIWHSIPAQLSHENKKFKYSEIKKAGRKSHFESAIEWLNQAGLIHVCCSLKVPKLPPVAYIDHDKFKVYLHDTGLLGAMLELHPKTILFDSDLFSEFNGAFIENYTATELIKYCTNELFYWTSKSEAEVDFILYHDNAFLPIEVKSGLNRSIKGLRVYADKFEPQRIYRTSPRNFTLDNDSVNIPLYAISRINEFNNDESKVETNV